MDILNRTKRAVTASSGQKEKKQKKEKKRKKKSTKKLTKQRPIFPVADIHNQLEKGKPRGCVTPEVPLYLAAAEEYFCCELIEMAVNSAVSRGSGAIDVQDVVNAIRNDPELNRMVGDVIKDF